MPLPITFERRAVIEICCEAVETTHLMFLDKNGGLPSAQQQKLTVSSVYNSTQRTIERLSTKEVLMIWKGHSCEWNSSCFHPKSWGWITANFRWCQRLSTQTYVYEKALDLIISFQSSSITDLSFTRLNISWFAADTSSFTCHIPGLIRDQFVSLFLSPISED